MREAVTIARRKTVHVAQFFNTLQMFWFNPNSLVCIHLFDTYSYTVKVNVCHLAWIVRLRTGDHDEHEQENVMNIKMFLATFPVLLWEMLLENFWHICLILSLAVVQMVTVLRNKECVLEKRTYIYISFSCVECGSLI